ncbi:MAG: HAD family phosphatase [Armatimonadetes bacterium]|nr:HAD family phosphatase [Armatimonadota bacterium]
MTDAAPPPIRLLLADVDGTLVTNDKALTERAIAAVHKLHDVGIAFAVTSGRPPRGMTMLSGPLAFSTPIAGFNGGIFVKPDLTILETHALPPSVPLRVIEAIEAHGLDAWVYRGNDWLIRKKDAPHVAREAWTVKFEPTVVPNFDDVLDNVVKIVGVTDDRDRMDKCVLDVQKQFGRQVSAACSQPYYLDVTHPNANKGAVVTWMSQHLNIPPEQIATIGDQPSDTLMFDKSGLSIAMGNASDQVKRDAKRVTDSNQDEGFAKAVEMFILPASSR